MIYLCLTHLDGILEDRRSRVKYFLEIMNNFKEKEDLVGILLSFVQKSKSIHHRDIASHILAILIDAEKPNEKVAQDSKDFLNMLTTKAAFGQNNDSLVSLHALSFALMTMMKNNQLAREFCNALGFKILN